VLNGDKSCINDFIVRVQDGNNIREETMRTIPCNSIGLARYHCAEKDPKPGGLGAIRV